MNLEVICDVCTYILNNLDENITLDIISKEFNYNKYYLIRSFKEYTGYTLVDYINYAKIYKSLDLFYDQNRTILNIALNNGFNSQEYYSEKFKEVIGISPIKLKKILQNLRETNDLKLITEIKEYILKIEEEKNRFKLIPFEEKGKVKMKKTA